MLNIRMRYGILTTCQMTDYIDRLLSYVPPERVMTLSCGHVIPAENLIAWPVSSGPNGIVFDFTFTQRKVPAIVDELGAGIFAMCQIIPDGVVVFFPSYAYLDHVVDRWQMRTGPAASVWDQLAGKKAVFQESRGSASVDDTLNQYSKAIDAGQGGLLLSVIGGKMSEGINFSDKLGRAVIVVGLPYPDINSTEWQAKITHIEKCAVARGASGAEAKAAGREFYENACMRAVNQSIGRAIRHRNDYASILLLDRRYETDRIKTKLPGWIRESLAGGVIKKPFSDVAASLTAFFKGKE